MPTQKYLTFQISLQLYAQINTEPTLAYTLLEQEIVRRHGFLAFQTPENIGDALSYIWAEPHKWQVLSNHLQMNESDVRTQLKSISIRRNQIVHEGDYSSSLLQRQAITEQDTEAVMKFISDLAEAIYEEIK